METSALEEKINKIKQQNEEIKRRYEEVEEDKKNAAKLNALVQMVPSTDWPERKEPPEFSNPPRGKQKPLKERQEYVLQSHCVAGKTIHAFAEGEGPPPDPKYNFLADSEREETGAEFLRENDGSRTYNKLTRGNLRKKATVREGMHKDNKIHKGTRRDEYQPGYDAWRAERNRIDEDRISRQRTAEGNWRREWDNDKMHVADDAAKAASRSLGDFTKKDPKEFDRRYHTNGNEHISQNRGGGQRPHRGLPKNFHGNYENRSHNTYDQHRHQLPVSVKAPLSPTFEERTVTATDKSIKVTLNQGNGAKGPLMSVKVNSPSIAGTGRVGPRQRTRVTYSHSDAEVPTPETDSFSRQKSFENKSKGSYFNNQKSPNVRRSLSQKKEKVGQNSPYLQRKETKGEVNGANAQRPYDDEFRPSQQKDNQRPQTALKSSQRPMSGDAQPTKHDASNVGFSYKQKDEGNVRKFDTNLEESIPCPNLDTQNARTIVVHNEIFSEICKSTSSNMEKSDVQNSETDIEYKKVMEQEELENTEAAILDNETIDTSVPSVDVANFQCFAKDNNENGNIIEKEKQNAKEYANTTVESLQEDFNLSDVGSPLDKVELQEKFDTKEAQSQGISLNEVQTDGQLVLSEDQSQEKTTLDEVQLQHVSSLQNAPSPQMAGLKEVELSEEITSNDVQLTQMTKTKEIQSPEQATSNEVQLPQTVDLDVIQSTEQVTSDEVQLPQTVNLGVVQSTEQITLGKVSSLHDETSNKIQPPQEVPLGELQLQEIISNELESQKVVASDISNNVTDDIIKVEALSEYNQQSQSSREVSEPSVNDNCDNIKEETCSVIGATTGGSMYRKEALQNETLDRKSETNEKDESTTCYKKDSGDTTSCSEVKTEDIVKLSTVSADGYFNGEIESHDVNLAGNGEKEDIENVTAKKE